MKEIISRFIYLKYEILKNKFIYYCSPLDKKGHLIEGISDDKYDEIDSEYQKLWEEHECLRIDETNVSEMVGFEKDSRSSRFAMIYVYVNAMDEEEYKKYYELLLKDHDYDIGYFREVIE